MGKQHSASRRVAPTASPGFYQRFREHYFVHGPRLLAETVIMLQTFVPPIVVLVGTKVLEAWGAHSQPLHVAEVFDAYVLAFLVAIIALNSFGHFVSLTIASWRQ